MILQKIGDRFPSKSVAFRYFDSDCNMQLTFNEFAMGIDKLRIKLSYEDIWKVFRYKLDPQGTGFAGFKEFCNLLGDVSRDGIVTSKP